MKHNDQPSNQAEDKGYWNFAYIKSGTEGHSTLVAPVLNCFSDPTPTASGKYWVDEFTQPNKMEWEGFVVDANMFTKEEAYEIARERFGVKATEALPNDSSPDLRETHAANPAKLPYREELDDILHRVYEQGVVDEHGEVKKGELVHPELAMQPSKALDAIQSLITRAQVTTLKQLKLELRHMGVVRRVVDRRIQELNQENNEL